MSPRLHHRRLWNLDQLSGADVLALVAGAHALKRAEQCGIDHRPLRGKNLAVLGGAADRADHADTEALRRAVADLGAKLACIPSADLGTAATVALLGRLYDALDCEGLGPALVERLEREAGVPVYNGLAHPDHPMRALAELMRIEERSARPLAQTRACVIHDRATAGALAALLQAGALVGMDLRIVAPAASWPGLAHIERAQMLARAHGGHVRLTEHEADGAANTDLLLDHRHAPDGADDAVRYALQALLLSSIG